MNFPEKENKITGELDLSFQQQGDSQDDGELRLLAVELRDGFNTHFERPSPDQSLRRNQPEEE